MFKYKINFMLASEVLRDTTDLSAYKKEIEQATNMYTIKSQQSPNPKSLSILAVSQRTITVLLTSETILSSPQKATRLFSSELVNGAFSHLVRNGRLFSGNAVKYDENAVKEMSDVEMINHLMKMCFESELKSSTEKKESRALIGEIKSLLLNKKEGGQKLENES